MANLVINVAASKGMNTGSYLYKDLKMPMTSQIEANYDVNAIKQSIHNIFTFRLGQRILNPVFGNVLYSYLYEQISPVTIKNMTDACRNMLKYEPRISVTKINVQPNYDNNEIQISIEYVIPKLNYVGSYSTSVTVTQS